MKFTNEPILDYRKGSKERKALKKALRTLSSTPFDIPNRIGGQDHEGLTTHPLTAPHNHDLLLANVHIGQQKDIRQSINNSLKSKYLWRLTSFKKRADIFLKAADLIAGKYRHLLNAASMLGQGKSIYQSEIDTICELVDFLRFNVQYANEIRKIQPSSAKGIRNQLEYRPLEGFILAITPFNFTAIAGNLCAAPALMGNTVVWKPAENQMLTAHFLLQIFEEAGLPPGVINRIQCDGPTLGKIALSHPDFAGLHFTGSTAVFEHLYKEIGNNISRYKTFPRIVGETGGKDFIIAHPSANIKAVATAITRGSFEFQGQKCSAASRVYLPQSIWPEIEEILMEQLNEVIVGPPTDFKAFVNAVINEKSFLKIKKYIDGAKRSPKTKVIFGGKCDQSIGYFVEPTVVLTTDPFYKTMAEEIFGPVVTIFLYEDEAFADTLDLINQTSPYALTGAIFSKSKKATKLALKKLEDAAGNFYINDKPTGAVVDQQPFGGARKSGTNDKAGSMLNLLRWVSPRTIKENLSPPEDFKYPFME